MCNKTIIIGVKYLQRPEYSGCEAEAEASYVAGFPVRMWLRLVTSRGSRTPPEAEAEAEASYVAGFPDC